MKLEKLIRRLRSAADVFDRQTIIMNAAIADNKKLRLELEDLQELREKARGVDDQSFRAAIDDGYVFSVKRSSGDCTVYVEVTHQNDNTLCRVFADTRVDMALNAAVEATSAEMAKAGGDGP